jgi:hypothetical protein
LISANASVHGGNNTASYPSYNFNIPSFQLGTLASMGFSTPATVALGMVYLQSVSSGTGGVSAAIAYNNSGPNAWLNTNNAHGLGADSPTLDTISFSGTIAFTQLRTSSNWQSTGGTDVFETRNVSKGNLVLNTPQSSGNNGSPGGNNRTAARGGGAPGGGVNNNIPSNGQAGSITIYKIY